MGIITHLIKSDWDHVCSKPSSLERCFIDTGCVMTECGDYDRLIYPQSLSNGKYTFY